MNKYQCQVACEVKGSPKDLYTFPDGTKKPLLWSFVDLASSKDPLHREHRVVCLHHKRRVFDSLDKKGCKFTVMPLEVYLEKRAEMEKQREEGLAKERAEKEAIENLFAEPVTVE